MKLKISSYWLCQIGGWLAYCVIYTIFYFLIRTQPQPHFFETVLTDAIFGILVTHTMRYVIKAGNFFDLKPLQQIFAFIIVTLVFAFCYSVILIFIEDKVLDIFGEQFKKYTFLNKVIRSWYLTSLFIFIWNLLYYLFHFIKKSQVEQLDKIRLESLVKELELKTIKSHIHPHFIFNTLNSIRALIDESPENARTAITQLSNILRSSMYAEKVETTTLEKELSIVKDYLALEFIRFEDRLKVEYEIDEDTLDQPIPPMMLQTLVENAIKHGISKQINGGVIRIISTFKNNSYQLLVQNTGQLNIDTNAQGFGIASTYDRLNLLFDKKAKFELKNIDNMVQASIAIAV